MGICEKGIARAKVRASNGKPSILYNDLLTRFNDRDLAISLYAKAMSDNFSKLAANNPIERDVNGEPKIEAFLNFTNENYDLVIDNKTTQDSNYLYYDKEEGQMFGHRSMGFEASDDDQLLSDKLDANIANGSVVVNDKITVEEISKQASTPRNKVVINKRPIRTNELNGKRVDSSIDNNLEDADRIKRYKESLKDITKQLDVRINSLNGLTESLRKNDNKATREKIVELRKSIAIANKERDHYLHELSKIDEVNDSLDLTSVILKDIARIEKDLDSKDLTMIDLMRFDKAINIWLNAASNFVIQTDDIQAKKNINDIVGRAHILNDKFVKVQNQLYSSQMVEASTNPKYKGDHPVAYDAIEEFEKTGDANVFLAYTMAVNRNPHTGLQIVHKIIEKGHMRVMAKVNKLNAKVDEMTKAISDFSVFEEKHRDGNRTGMMLHYIAPEFREKENMFNYDNERSNGTYIEKNNNKLNFIRKNKIVLDPRILFKDETDESGELLYKSDKVYTDEDVQNHIDEVIQALGGGTFGKEEFDILKARLKDKVDAYKLELDAVKDTIHEAETEDGENKQANLLINFELRQSPYKALEAIDNAHTLVNAKGKQIVNIKTDSLPSVPKRFERNIDGTQSTIETGNYNKGFDSIINNAKHLEFYRFYTKRINQLNSMLPEHLKINGDSDNYVAMIDKSLIELLRTPGVNFKELMDEESMKMYSKAGQGLSSRNPLTGKLEYRLTIPSTNSEKVEIDKATDVAVALEVARLGRSLTTEEIFMIRRKAINEIAFRNKFNLANSLKLFNYQVENYMHKVNAEDAVKCVKNILDNAQEVRETKNGEIRLDNKDSFINLKKQLDYYIEVFYGYDKSVEVLNKKVYTEVDKAKIIELKEALAKLEAERIDPSVTLSDDEYETRKLMLEEGINDMGRFKSTDQMLRSALKYSQFKAMGFNYGAAITNLIQGYIANSIESKDGRIFNQRQLLRAYSIMGGIVSSFYSRGNLSTEAAEKVMNLARRYDLIGETSSELEFEKFEKDSIFNNVYIFQNSTEYLNQAPVIIGTMLNTKIEYIAKDGSTKTTNLWDALDKDGNFKEDIKLVDEHGWVIGADDMSGDKFLDTMAKSAQAIRAIHGNYSKLTPTLMNSNAVLASAKQFKTWMFEAVAQRLEGYKWDEELAMGRKGRWRTGFSVVTLAKSKEYKEGESMFKHACDNTLYVTGQLMRRIVFLNTHLDRFDEVDAANIRKNIASAIITMRLLAVGIALGAMLKNSDDDDDDTKSMLRYQINVANRLIDDMQMYYSPTSLQNMIKNILPMMSTLTDVQNFIKGLYYLMTDKVTETGVYAGENEGLRYIYKSLPILSKYSSTRAMMLQVMNTRK